jgi:hypothetical protein
LQGAEAENRMGVPVNHEIYAGIAQIADAIKEYDGMG